MTKRGSIVLCVLLYSSFAIAHGGMEHVLGTITAVTDHTLSVKTTAGPEVQVEFDPETHFLKGETPATAKDVHVGDRVVIHAHKHDNGLHAAEVKIGVKAAAKPN